MLDFLFAIALLILGVLATMRGDGSGVQIAIGVLACCAGVGMGCCWGGSMLGLEDVLGRGG